MDKKDFIKKFKVKKSIDFYDANVRISDAEQALAQTADESLIKYLKDNLTKDINKIPFDKGTLTAFKKQEGLYGYSITDNDGQILESHDAATPEMIAKNLQMKSFANVATGGVDLSEMQSFDAESEYVEPSLEKIEETVDKPGHYIKIKCGDFEFEMKKSLSDFIKTHKKSTTYKDSILIKALKNSKYRSQSVTKHAKELLENWDSRKEGFLQAIDAVNREG